MITSEARIEANRKNAALSTGPKTEAGKERSRQNSLKHGMTGAGIVLPEADAAEVTRRTTAFAEELCAVGEVAQALVRLAALNSVRAERCADQQTAALAQRVRQVEAEFVEPEGASVDEAAKLRDEAVRIAMFDPSREAVLARKYEAAAERGFYKALKLLRQMDKESEALLKADDTNRVDAMMASFLSKQNEYRKMDAEMEELYPELAEPMPTRPANFTQTPKMEGAVDVPFTIGRPR
jgi:hypothetical protein